MVPVVVLCVTLALSAAALAQDAPAEEPGLDAGSAAPSFAVTVVSGPEEIVGQEVDFVRHEGYDPLLLMLVTERNEEVDSAILKLNEWAAVKNGDEATGFHAVIVFIGEFDPEAIIAWSEEHQTVIPMGIAMDPESVVSAYDIPDETAALIQVLSSDDTMKQGLVDLDNIDAFLESLGGEQPVDGGDSEEPAEDEAQ